MNQLLPMRREQRLSPRRQVNILASIAYNAGRSHMGCIIRNLSDTGAKLEMRNTRDIPTAFDLLRPGFDAQPCRVIWRAERELGVQFSPQ